MDDVNDLYIVTYKENYYPMTEKGTSVKEITKVSQEVLKESISKTVSTVIDSLDESEKSKENSNFEIDEVNFQLTVTGEGKVSFLSADVQCGMGTTFDIKIKRKKV